MNTDDARRLLEVDRDVTGDRLRSAYLEQVMVWHPDRFKSGTDLFERAVHRTQRLNEAYTLLSRVPALSPGPAVRYSQPQGSAIGPRSSPTAPTVRVETTRRPSSRARRWVGPLGAVLLSTVGFGVGYRLGQAAPLAGEPVTGGGQSLSPSAIGVGGTGHVEQGPADGDRATPSPLLAGDASRFFTLGSTREEVLGSMGAPTSAQSQAWTYGTSVVHFDTLGLVDSYANPRGTLRVVVLPTDVPTSPQTFWLGATEDEVLVAMGTPTSLDRGLWRYGEALVVFDRNGRVAGYADTGGRLRLGARHEATACFAIDANPESVRAAMGVPSSVHERTWRYGPAEVYFDLTGRVSGFNNPKGTLNLCSGSDSGGRDESSAADQRQHLDPIS